LLYRVKTYDVPVTQWNKFPRPAAAEPRSLSRFDSCPATSSTGTTSFYWHLMREYCESELRLNLLIARIRSICPEVRTGNAWVCASRKLGVGAADIYTPMTCIDVLAESATTRSEGPIVAVRSHFRGFEASSIARALRHFSQLKH
jgi:hypothetical protein